MVVAAGIAAGVTLAAAACGGTGGLSTGGDVARGELLFKQKCGSCHTLAAAGTPGTIGPNLDDAFGSARAQGFAESSIRQVVAGQIRHPLIARNGKTPTGTTAMPANVVTGDDVDAVAAYVASVAGKPGAKAPAGGGQAASGKDIFKQNCGTCHTLADAGTNGTVGPNLDQAKPSKALAVERVTNGKSPMPPFKGVLTPAQIKAVTDYVSSVTK